MRAAASLLILALLGCASAAIPGQVRVAHLPPDRIDILEALILSEAVSLAGDPGCAWTAEEEADRTLGRYLAGLFTGPYESYTDAPGVNWIEIATTPEPADAGALWRSRMLVHAGAREPRGLEFLSGSPTGGCSLAAFDALRAPRYRDARSDHGSSSLSCAKRSRPRSCGICLRITGTC